MLDNEGAGAGGQDDDGQAGNGAPAGGSPEGGSEKDDKPITAKQLKAALESQKRHYEGRLDSQRAEFQAFKEGVGKQPGSQVEKPKVFAKADLKAAVAAGQITQDQSDEIWEQQLVAQVTEKAEAKALDAVSAKTAKDRIDADLDKYKRLAPEIMDASSDERQKIVAEYKELTATGMPKNLATELAAIRAVMGPLDKLETARSARRRVEHDEQSGGGGEGRRSNSGKTLVDQLDARKKGFYEDQIKKGRYKDWNAVEAELKFARR